MEYKKVSHARSFVDTGIMRLDPLIEILGPDDFTEDVLNLLISSMHSATFCVVERETLEMIDNAVQFANLSM